MVLSLQESLRANVTPLPPLTEPKLGVKFDKFNDCRVLLIGAPTYGTSEFYTARAKITRHLVRHHGFNIVAIQADWLDGEKIDNYVRRRLGVKTGTDVAEKETAFQRFPKWMWGNQETQTFVEWLRSHNKGLAKEKMAGFYGLDLYSMAISTEAILNFWDHTDPEIGILVRKRFGSSEPWVDHPQEHGLGALAEVFKGGEASVLRLLRGLLDKRLDFAKRHEDSEDFHSAEENAKLVADAERYYKTLYYSEEKAWNLRETHMFETLLRLLKFRGKSSKAVVWAHNCHVGNALAMSMGSRNLKNLGQLAREKFGKDVISLGFGTYTGTVAAAHEWGSDMQIMEIPPALEESYEFLAHETGLDSFYIDLREGKCDDELRKELLKKRLQRFIGVIYYPETERDSHYSAVELPREFDGYIWFDTTSAVRPLDVHQPDTPLESNEIYPFGK